MGHMIAWLRFTAYPQSSVHYNMREHRGLLFSWQEKKIIEILCVPSQQRWWFLPFSWMGQWYF